MKRQKKYLSRAEIIKDIDRALKRHSNLIGAAYKCEIEMLKCRELGNNVAEKIYREKANELLGKAERLKFTRLKKLQNALAAFDTVPLGIESAKARQIVLEKI